MKIYRLILAVVLLGSVSMYADEFSFEDFVGTWEGYSYSQNTSSWNTAMTINVEPNGFYTDSSGLLMPPYYYPNTQDSEYDVSTNRLHFWYLDTVYAGMQFYQHFFYEVVNYDGYNLELHYNYWDDPEPHPQVQTISLTKAGYEPMGMISGYVTDMDDGMPLYGVNVMWGDLSIMTNEDGYYQLESLSGTNDLEFYHQGFLEYGIENIELEPNQELSYDVMLQSQYDPPQDLKYDIQGENVILEWSSPMGNSPQKYYIYRNMKMIGETKDTSYMDSSVPFGKNRYYVTAKYDSKESIASNKITIIWEDDNDDGMDKNLLSVQNQGNYPNPFNPTTSIRFKINEAQPVQLEIFNIRGQKVKTLLNETLSPREYSVTWNGDDNNGNQVPSGIYLYRIKTPIFSEMRKMNLMK